MFLFVAYLSIKKDGNIWFQRIGIKVKSRVTQSSSVYIDNRYSIGCHFILQLSIALTDMESFGLTQHKISYTGSTKLHLNNDP